MITIPLSKPDELEEEDGFFLERRGEFLNIQEMNKEELRDLAVHTMKNLYEMRDQASVLLEKIEKAVGWTDKYL